MNWYCSNPWTTLFVWGNGDVTHCCYSNYGSLGNIRELSPDSIWRGSKLAAIRSAMAVGNFEKAGCEPFCRAYRWQRFYGQLESPPPIPEGLGRIKNEGKILESQNPQILGAAIDWRCNMRCTHCGGSRKSPGLTAVDIAKLEPWLENATTLRFMNGEYSINSDALRQIQEISKRKNQPRLFLNTNGHISLSKYLPAINDLAAFHLKFSLEGIGKNYEKVRKGGQWDNFYKNLCEASELFQNKQAEGKDWKLHLNFCLMHSNVAELPEVVALAVGLNLPLVINSIHGMRYMQENMFAYAHLRPETAMWRDMVQRSIAIAEEHHYPWTDDIRTHLAYIESCFSEPMLEGIWIRWLSHQHWSSKRWVGVLLYLTLRLKLSKIDGMRYFLRKSWNYLRRKGYIPARLKRLKAESRIPLIKES